MRGTMVPPFSSDLWGLSHPIFYDPGLLEHPPCNDGMLAVNFRWILDSLSQVHFDRLVEATFAVFDSDQCVGNAIGISKGDGKTLFLSAGQHDASNRLQVNQQEATVLFSGTQDNIPFTFLEIPQELLTTMTLDPSPKQKDAFIHLYYAQHGFSSEFRPIAQQASFEEVAPHGATVMSLSTGHLCGIHYQEGDEHAVLHVSKLYDHLKEAASDNHHPLREVAVSILHRVSFKGIDPPLPLQQAVEERAEPAPTVPEPCDEEKVPSEERANSSIKEEGPQPEKTYTITFPISQHAKSKSVTICYETVDSNPPMMCGIRVWNAKSKSDKFRVTYGISPNPSESHGEDNRLNTLCEVFAKSIWRTTISCGKFPMNLAVTYSKTLYKLTKVPK